MIETNLNRFQHTLTSFAAGFHFCKAKLLLFASVFLYSAILSTASVAQTEGDSLLPYIDEYGAGDPIYDEIQRIAEFFAARLGVPLGHPVVVLGDYSAIDIVAAPHGGQILAVTIPVRPEPDPARTGHRKWHEQARGSDASLHTCGIFLSVGVTAVSQLELKNSLAHEVIHCFQMKITGIDRLYELPQWITEGTASFAGEDYTEFGSPPNNRSLEPLLDRTKICLRRRIRCDGIFLSSQGARCRRL